MGYYNPTKSRYYGDPKELERQQRENAEALMRKKKKIPVGRTIAQQQIENAKKKTKEGLLSRSLNKTYTGRGR